MKRTLWCFWWRMRPIMQDLRNKRGRGRWSLMIHPSKRAASNHRRCSSGYSECGPLFEVDAYGFIERPGARLREP